nr:DNA Primase [uncultured bacterium]
MTAGEAVGVTRWGRVYLDLGWRLLLLAPGTKLPLRGTRGVLDSIADPGELADRVARLGGRCNLGVVTGASGLLVVDIDRGHAAGVDGEVTLADLAAGAELPEGPQQLTPSGGRHILFRAVDDIGPSAGLIGPGIDVRAGRSYVVVAPSTVRAGRYRWLTSPGTPPPELPEWLRPPTRQPTGRPAQARVLPTGAGCLSGLARTVGEAVEGTRNDTASWAAYRAGQDVAAGRVDEETAVSVIAEAALSTGLPPAEVETVVSRGVRDGIRAGRRAA